jgi:hypothetical protein
MAKWLNGYMVSLLTAGLKDCQTAGLPDCLTEGLPDCKTAGLLNSWIIPLEEKGLLIIAIP